MKKMIIILIIVTVLFSAFAFADDLSAMTDEELYALHEEILSEMTRRGLPAEQEVYPDPEDISKRVFSFFVYWSDNNPVEMLTLCDSGWKSAFENPQTELERILAGRTPLDFVIGTVDKVAGEGPDNLPYYLVTGFSHLGQNDGTAYEQYRIRLLVRKEADGLWYINPSGLENCEITEEEISAETMSESGDDAGTVAMNTVLYYQPTGGEYYHRDPNCRMVNSKYLPLQGIFLYSELEEEPYCNLKPCQICITSE